MNLKFHINKLRWRYRTLTRKFRERIIFSWLSLMNKRFELPFYNGERNMAKKSEVVETSEVPVKEVVAVSSEKKIRAVREEVMGMFGSFEQGALDGFVTLLRHYGNLDQITLEEATTKHRVLLEDLKRRYVTNTNRVLERHFSEKNEN
jgi:hypothetical protein